VTTKAKPKSYAHEVSALAAIRWYANTIENVALEKYCGKVSRYRQIDRILKNTIKELKAISSAGFRKEPDCPWPICPNDICAPSCNGGFD